MQKKSIFSRTMVFLFAFLIAFSVSVSPVYAQNTSEWTKINPKCVGKGTNEQDVATLVGIECVVSNILAIAVTAVGVASFVMLIVGALLYSTSGGNPKGTETGQKTITAAFIGIALSVSGFIALNFISSFTGVESIKTFQIELPDK